MTRNPAPDRGPIRETGSHATDQELSILIEDAVRRGVERAVESFQAMKPLMKEADVCATLAVGRTKFKEKIEPRLPPLLVEGQRRWHPDSVEAYIRQLARKRR